MAEKKFPNKTVIDAIVAKFGSVVALSKILKLDRASVYQRIERQSGKFLKELRELGVILPGSNPFDNNMLKNENINLKKELEELRKQNSFLLNELIALKTNKEPLP